jgi:hypothetical protein
MQVIVTDTPGNARCAASSSRVSSFFERHGVPAGFCLLQAGVRRASASCSKRADHLVGAVLPGGQPRRAQAVFGRAKLGECSDADLGVFARTLARLAAAYARLGIWASTSLFPQAEGRNDGTHWLGARLLPRFYLNPQLHNSDVAYLQLLLGEKFGMLRPEAHAAELRNALITS